jgi:hypothetical protein
MPKGGVKALAAKEAARIGLGNAEAPLLAASPSSSDPGATSTAEAAGGMAAAASSAGARALLKDLGELVVGKVRRRLRMHEHPTRPTEYWARVC